MAHPEWALAFEDEVWWSRLAHPALHAWADPDRPLRLVEQTVAKEDPDPKALACYGLLVRTWTDGPAAPPHEAAWLRFVDGRPISAVTTRFLDWACGKLAAAGTTALLLVWDNASWHLSKEVRQWIGTHNRHVRETGNGVRIVSCPLPIKSPWLNPIETRASYYRDTASAAPRTRQYYRPAPWPSARRAAPARGAALPRAGGAALGDRIAGREPAVRPRFLVHALGVAVGDGAARDGASAPRPAGASRASVVAAQSWWAPGPRRPRASPAGAGGTGRRDAR